MVNAPTLFPEQAEAQSNEVNFFIYWRRPVDGWIIGAQGHAGAFASKVKRGFTPLPQFGSFMPGDRSTDVRGVPFSAAREGWRVGFQKGGADFAKEFPVDQIIAYSWHITPPYREVVFPQLEGIAIQSYECPECVRMPITRAADLATHLKIAHDYGRVDIKAYGDEINVDFTQKASREQSAELQQLAEAQLRASGAMPLATEFACDWAGCNWAPGEHVNDKERSLRTHVRMAHERTRVQDEPALEGSESDGETAIQPAYAS